MNESGHILVAEDDPTDAYFFQRAFRRAGLPVVLHFVRDGQEWVRQQPGFSSLQVVIFSSSDEAKDINRAYGLGANWYLVKPHSMDELTALVGRFKKFWLEGANDRSRKAA